MYILVCGNRGSAPLVVENLNRSLKIMKDIFLKTSDGVRVAADVYDVAHPKGWVVFLHMMPATKESWWGLAEVFAR